MLNKTQNQIVIVFMGIPHRTWSFILYCKRFFITIINDWNNFCEDSWTKDLANEAYFWID